MTLADDDPTTDENTPLLMRATSSPRPTVPGGPPFGLRGEEGETPCHSCLCRHTCSVDTLLHNHH